VSVKVYVSVGSNIDREEHIGTALTAMENLYGLLQLSAVYESEAVGFDSFPFYNLVVGFESDLPPLTIQQQLHGIENQCGRVRTSDLVARTLDLDLLLCGDEVIHSNELHIPRADITRYAFVLCPLADIAGDSNHPETGIAYRTLWNDFTGNKALTRIPWPSAWPKVGPLEGT
jgi:2-amino-4-hydroxy-6-hydroxymethyldihydropteridine diphosphokinase